MIKHDEEMNIDFQSVVDAARVNQCLSTTIWMMVPTLYRNRFLTAIPSFIEIVEGAC
jgi:hypothetical protein